MNLTLRHRDGAVTALAAGRWFAPASEAERDLLATLDAPVIDIGCGPGRLTEALAQLGVPALGVDISPHAVARTIGRGAAAVCGSVFDRLPDEGRWRAALLFDGNIGIGGDPARILARLRDLLAPDGTALVEVDPPGSDSLVRTVRVEHGDRHGPWFSWAWLAADRLGALLAAAGLAFVDWHCFDGRWVARLAPA